MSSVLKVSDPSRRIARTITEKISFFSSRLLRMGYSHLPDSAHQTSLPAQAVLMHLRQNYDQLFSRPFKYI